MYSDLELTVGRRIGDGWDVISSKDNYTLIQFYPSPTEDIHGYRALVNHDDKTICRAVPSTTGEGIFIAGAIYECVIGDVSPPSGETILQRIETIVRVPSSAGWRCEENKGDLYLLHYDDKAPMHNVGFIRGTVVDIKSGAIVASSFGYTPLAVKDVLEPLDDKISVRDLSGITHEFPLEGGRTIIKRAFEGVVIRVFKHNGTVYYSSHKHLDVSKSRWGKSPTFMEMYTELGGPKEEELFSDKLYSPFCYVFIIVHPALLTATRQHVAKGYIVHISTDFMWNVDPEACPYPISQVETTQMATFKQSPMLPSVVMEPFIHSPEPLSVEDANGHLKYGYYQPFDINDSRQLTGEALVMCLYDDAGYPVDVVRINSSSFAWRSSLRNEDNNIAHRFFVLLDLANPPIPMDTSGDNAYTSFISQFVMFPLYTKEQLENLYTTNNGILALQPGGDRSLLVKKENRIHIIWINFLLSLPPSQQKDAFGLLEEYYSTKAAVINWVVEMKNAGNIKAYLEKRGEPRVESLIRITNRNVMARKVSEKPTFRSELKRVMETETAASLYKLRRAEKDYRSGHTNPNDSTVAPRPKKTGRGGRTRHN